MNGARRKFFQDAAILGAALLGLSKDIRAEKQKVDNAPKGGGIRQHASGHDAYLPMVTPDSADLPHEMEGGVKVFHLVAEPLKKKIVPFKILDVWGYNGSCPGPTIQVQQGDRVRILFENRLPEST